MADMAIAQLAEARAHHHDRIADLKEAHELRHTETMRAIKALAEEVEYLRAQHFGPAVTQGVAPAKVPAMPEWDFMPQEHENPHWLPEEAEDILALQDGGHLSRVEAEGALAHLRARLGTRVPIQIEDS